MMRLFDFINDEKRLFADRRFSWPACTLHKLVIAPAKTQSRSGDTSLALRERGESREPSVPRVDYDDVLPHVLLGEVTRYLIASAIPEKSVVEALNIELREGHREVRELIAVSFVENIENQAELRHLTQGSSAEEIVHEWYSQQD